MDCSAVSGNPLYLARSPDPGRLRATTSSTASNLAHAARGRARAARQRRARRSAGAARRGAHDGRGASDRRCPRASEGGRRLEAGGALLLAGARASGSARRTIGSGARPRSPPTSPRSPRCRRSIPMTCAPAADRIRHAPDAAMPSLPLSLDGWRRLERNDLPGATTALERAIALNANEPWRTTGSVVAAGAPRRRRRLDPVSISPFARPHLPPPSSATRTSKRAPARAARPQGRSGLGYRIAPTLFGAGAETQAAATRALARLTFADPRSAPRDGGGEGGNDLKNEQRRKRRNRKRTNQFFFFFLFVGSVAPFLRSGTSVTSVPRLFRRDADRDDRLQSANLTSFSLT